MARPVLGFGYSQPWRFEFCDFQVGHGRIALKLAMSSKDESGRCEAPVASLVLIELRCSEVCFDAIHSRHLYMYARTHGRYKGRWQAANPFRAESEVLDALAYTTSQLV